MRKKMLFFINPSAGREEIRTRLMDVLDLFTARGYDVTVHPTQAPREIIDIIKTVGEQYDLIVTSGGDGTLNETVSGLMGLKKRPLLGYIPAGTVNDFASSLKIPKAISEAAENVVSGQPFQCDIGSFNERYFCYVAAFGAFTEVSYQTPHAQKQALGRAAYIWEGAKRLGEVRPYHVKVSWPEGEFEDDVEFGMISSATSVGGFKAPADTPVHLDDGLFEVTLVHNVKNVLDLNAMMTALMRWDFRSDFFYTFQTNEVRFAFQEEVPWTLDGEFGGSVTAAEIHANYKAIEILTPGTP